MSGGEGEGANATAASLLAAAKIIWDIAIIGAGPAGAAAAISLAQQNKSVLLIDKANFPRWKVCGCCLNAAGLAALETLGLGDLPIAAKPLASLRLSAGGRHARIPLRRCASLSRETLDSALVRRAVAAGARFRAGTHARLADDDVETRRIRLRQNEVEATVAARLVLAADGLGSHLLDGQAGLRTVPRENSRIGAGTVLADAPDFYGDGVIYMACGRGGYAGLVRLEDGRLDVAAAIDPIYMKDVGGAGPAVAAILGEAGLPPIGGLAASAWRGTPRLTRRPVRLGAHRLLVMGDAAGYVEPFTGEGIAWALESGIAVAPLAAAAAERWSPAFVGKWENTHHRLLGRRQRTCRIVTGFLRRPVLTQAAVAVLSVAPALARPLVRATSGERVMKIKPDEVPGTI